MIRETWVQSQVASYQRLLKKWYLIPPCLTLSNIRDVSRVKWSNPGKGVAPSPTPWCSSSWKGSLLVTLDYGRQLYFYIGCKKKKRNFAFVTQLPWSLIILLPVLVRPRVFQLAVKLAKIFEWKWKSNWKV